MADASGEREVLTTSVSRLWVDDDDILHVEYRAGVALSAERVREQLEAAVAVAGDRPMRVLADMSRDVGTGDRAARDALGGPESAARTIAVAVIVGSAVTRAVASFFLAVTRPPFPLRMFTSEAEGLAWLRTFPPVPR